MRDSRGRRGAGLGDLIDRRRFLSAGVAGLVAGLGLALRPLAGRAHGGHPWSHAAAGAATALSGLPAGTVSALETSDYVYVSPLRSDGKESTCHAEVWFGWMDGAVYLITAVETWKARSVARGLDAARIWVGNHGRWKGLVTRNEAFRQAPHFDARASVDRDEARVERLLAIYDEKYPEEIGTWRDRMKNGVRDGTRVLIRYAPV